MHSMRDLRVIMRENRRDMLETVLNRPLPDGHTIESSTTVITGNGTVIINVYGPLDPAKPPAAPDIITVRPGKAGGG